MTDMLGIFGPLLICFCETRAFSAADTLRTARLLLCGLVALLLRLRRLVLARHLCLTVERDTYIGWAQSFNFI